MNRKDFLQKIPLFSDLSDDELDLVLTSSRQMHYKKNNIIFYEGDPGDYLLVVLSGKIKVVLLGENGQELILAMMGPGSYVGEMSLLEGAPRSATIMTMEPSDFIRLARDPILALIKQHPSLAMKILLTLSKRVREVSDQLRSMSMFDVYGRIIRCLIRLSQHNGARPPSRLVVENRPSNCDLAKMIGCARESVSRAMRVLQDNQFVTTVKKDIVIEERALHRYGDFGMQLPPPLLCSYPSEIRPGRVVLKRSAVSSQREHGKTRKPELSASRRCFGDVSPPSCCGP